MAKGPLNNLHCMFNKCVHETKCFENTRFHNVDIRGVNRYRSPITLFTYIFNYLKTTGRGIYSYEYDDLKNYMMTVDDVINKLLYNGNLLRLYLNSENIITDINNIISTIHNSKKMNFSRTDQTVVYPIIVQRDNKTLHRIGAQFYELEKENKTLSNKIKSFI